MAAERHGDQFQFKQLIQRSANSVFRLYLSDPSDASAVRQRFRELGCESEQSDIPKLIAVDIPGSVRMKPVAALLDEGLQIRSLGIRRGRIATFDMNQVCVVSGGFDKKEGVKRNTFAFAWRIDGFLASSPWGRQPRPEGLPHSELCLPPTLSQRMGKDGSPTGDGVRPGTRSL